MSKTLKRESVEQVCDTQPPQVRSEATLYQAIDAFGIFSHISMLLFVKIGVGWGGVGLLGWGGVGWGGEGWGGVGWGGVGWGGVGWGEVGRFR